LKVSGVEGAITFFYYDDLDGASRFYGEVLGLEKVIDVGFARVYRIAENAHVGLVDGKRGMLKPSANKPVMLSFIVDDVDAWHRRLEGKGVEIDQPPRKADYLDMKVLLFRDPEGHLLEILQFLTKPYGQPEREQRP